MYICKVLFERKMAFLTINKQKVCKTSHFLPFSYISGGIGAYFTPLTPSTTTLPPVTPLVNSRRTKQFFSRPHGL
jgi:hypothetical protein